MAPRSHDTKILPFGNLLTYANGNPESGGRCTRDQVAIQFGDALDFYKKWPSPVVIIADGPYGLGSFPGDPHTPDNLSEWYLPHLQEWARYSSPVTTLWFWNTELGWANVHRTIVDCGWEFRNCHIWNKGIGHIAGNCNTQTIRKFPVTTEVCVQYVRKAEFNVFGKTISMQEWLRFEWERTGLPLYKTNEACGVLNAATRKYFTKDHLWYFPPSDAFELLQKYANKFGAPSGRPYFSLDGRSPISHKQWDVMRAKFYCKNGVTNVWDEPAVRGAERIKDKYKSVHMNQKPIRLLERCIEASSDKGDVVWEPFGGLCSASIAAHRLARRGYAAEINPEFFDIASRRLENYDVF